MLTALLEACLLPPFGPLLLTVAGLLLRRRWPRLGRGFVIIGLLSLWLASTPAVGGALLGSLQRDRALALEGLPAADAIVVLSADTDVIGFEYGAPTIGHWTLQRLRYGCSLHRRTKLPVLVTGGPGSFGLQPLGDMMTAVAEQEFGVQVRWTEAESLHTFANASLSAPILEQAGVRRIYLVTHAWHMPRARACFEVQGFEVIAAPTAFRGPAVEGWRSFLPSWKGMRDSALALHEWIGVLYYHVAYLSVIA